MPCRRIEEEGNKGRVDGGRATMEELLQDVAPETVRAVERLKSDVQALKTLLEGDVPDRCWYRAAGLATAFYIPGDASRQGFGSAVITQAKDIIYKSGAWKGRWREESSNFQEVDP